MDLPSFINHDLGGIVREWTDFAGTQLPAALRLSDDALSDDACALLLAVARASATCKETSWRGDESQGERPAHALAISRAAQEHARQRFLQGFTLNQVVAEYRALRASVLRRWTEQLEDDAASNVDEVVRFGEAMDEGLTESIAGYSARLDRSRGLLLGVLGHDLRNPLGAAQMSATLLLDTELTDKQESSTHRIVKSTVRMQELIDNLLDFTRVSLGDLLPVSRGDIDLGDVCQEVVQELSAFHPDYHINYECRSPVPGTWDRARIGQMISNLIANAVHHSEATSPITVSVWAEAELGVVRVHNNGPAIPADVRATLFEPLRQGSHRLSERRPGSSGLGLGLYIAMAVATAHGGIIDVESSDAEGTSFSVSLPLSLPGVAQGSPDADQ